MPLIFDSLLSVVLLATPGAGATAPETALHEVAPIAIERAIPSNASDAVFLERISRDLTPAVDAYERAFGAAEAIAFIEDAPFPAMALEVLSGLSQQAVGVDPAGGLALYRVREYDGAVGVVAVSDAMAAQRALAEWFAHRGAATRRDEAGAVIVTLESGLEMRSFVRGRFLYVAMPLADDELFGGPADLEKIPQRAPPLGDPVRAIPEEKSAEGLDGDPLYVRLRAQVMPGHTFVFLRRPFEEELGVDGALLSFRMEERGVAIDGAIGWGGPSWRRAPGVRGSKQVEHALAAVPSSSVLAMTARISPAALIPLLFGPEGTERRLDADDLLRQARLAPQALRAALDGDASARFELDAGALAALAMGEEERPLGAFEVMLGLAHPRAIAPVPRWRVTVDGDPLHLKLTERHLRARYGALPKQEQEVALLDPVRARYGREAFSEGHVTLFLDVAALRYEIERTPLGPTELPPSLERDLRLQMAAPFAQFFGIEHVLLDLWQPSGDVRAKGYVRFAR